MADVTHCQQAEKDETKQSRNDRKAAVGIFHTVRARPGLRINGLTFRSLGGEHTGARQFNLYRSSRKVGLD